jgi:uncharacterized membrane-anchored protein
MNEPKRVKWLLECVTDDIDKLTDWEQSFVRSVEEQNRKNGGMSDKQYNTLERIYEERCQ